MSKIRLVVFRDNKGRAPFLDWFEGLPEKAQDKCRVRLERLKEFGHELRRPEAEYLREGIYELRFKNRGINYRVLYFFHGQMMVILSHGFSKQCTLVPEKEIKLVLERSRQFAVSPQGHTYEGKI